MKHFQFETLGLNQSPEAAVITVYVQGEALVIFYSVGKNEKRKNKTDKQNNMLKSPLRQRRVTRGQNQSTDPNKSNQLQII